MKNALRLLLVLVLCLFCVFLASRLWNPSPPNRYKLTVTFDWFWEHVQTVEVMVQPNVPFNVQTQDTEGNCYRTYGILRRDDWTRFIDPETVTKHTNALSFMFGKAFAQRCADEVGEKFHFERSGVSMRMKDGGSSDYSGNIGIGEFELGMGRGMARTDGVSYSMNLTKQ